MASHQEIVSKQAAGCPMKMMKLRISLSAQHQLLQSGVAGQGRPRPTSPGCNAIS